MKIFPVLSFVVAMIALPAMADDFGSRFGNTGTAALQDKPSDMIVQDLQNIAPAAGEAEEANDALSAQESIPSILPAPATIETEAGMEGSLQGPAEPEPTPQEKTESSVIHYDHGMSPDRAEDPSYRLQDSTP